MFGCTYDMCILVGWDRVVGRVGMCYKGVSGSEGGGRRKSTPLYDICCI